MNIVVNGELREVTDDIRLADVIALVTGAQHGIAVAVNEAVVPRRDWKTRVLVAADRVEVLTAVQGG